MQAEGLRFPFKNLVPAEMLLVLPTCTQGWMNTWTKTFPRGVSNLSFQEDNYLDFLSFFFFLCLLTKLSENGNLSLPGP